MVVVASSIESMWGEEGKEKQSKRDKIEKKKQWDQGWTDNVAIIVGARISAADKWCRSTTEELIIGEIYSKGLKLLFFYYI